MGDKKQLRKKKLKWRWLLLIGGIIILMVGALTYQHYKPELEASQSNIFSQAIKSFLDASTISPIRTEYNGNYRVKLKTGNESLYDVSFNKTQVSLGNITYYDEDLKKNVSVEQFRGDTIICLEAGWDEKIINIYNISELEFENPKAIGNYTYSVPSTLSFYKTDSLVKQPNLIKNKTNQLSATSPSNPNRFCYQANPDLDFYLKFGENSVIIIQEEDVVGDSLLINVTAETGDANFTHLNISTTAPYDDLVGYWSFDGDNVNSKGNTSYDFSQYNNDGTMVADAVVNSTGCIYDDCLQLDGAGDYVSIPYENIGGVVTYAFWAYLKEIKDAYFINYMDTGIRMTGTNAFRIVTNVTWGDFTALSCPTQVNAWVHYVFTHNGTHASCYADGGLEAGPTAAGSLKTTNTNNRIGGYSGSRYVNGSIDEVMIFNTSLTQAQITDIYNNQSARFFYDGWQQLNNQTYLNLSGTDVNVTTTLESNLGSSVNLSVGYYDGGWAYTAPQTITSGVNATFSTGTTFTNLTLNYTLIAGNSTNPFYSPLIKGDIVLDVYSVVADANPVSILSRPLDNNSTPQGVVTFEINATDDSNLLNVTLYVWNSSGGLITTNSTDWDGTSNTTTFTFNFAFDNVTHWNALVYDNASQSDWADANFTLTIAPADTCTCAGVDTNWEVDMGDYCNITTNCDLGTGTLSWTGSGWANCSAIINTTNMARPSANQILYTAKDCLINIFTWFLGIIKKPFLPMVQALSVSNTNLSSPSVNISVSVDSMDLTKIVVNDTAIELYNVSSPGTNFTNVNDTYNATIHFYGLIVNLAVYDVNISGYVFNATVGDQNYVAIFKPKQILRILSLFFALEGDITISGLNKIIDRIIRLVT